MQSAVNNASEEDLTSILTTCSGIHVGVGQQNRGGGGKKRSGGGPGSSISSTDSGQKRKKAKKELIEEFYCPLSGELFVDPVVADDGWLYDRDSIEQYIDKHRENLVSPKDPKKRMGTLLLPASKNVINAIQHLIDIGEIDEQHAGHWMQARVVVDAKSKADEGDTKAMCVLSTLYCHGGHGFAKDLKLSYQWASRASGAKDPTGMALKGFMLMHGAGCVRHNLKGLDLLTKASEKGSALAKFKLGSYFYEGLHGLPVDKLEATRHLRAVVDGKCKVNDLSDTALTDARKLLDELENGFESFCPIAGTQNIVSNKDDKKNETFD